MRVLYYGMLGGSDSVCPLMREFLSRGLDVICYFDIHTWGHKGPFLSFDRVLPKAGIFKATEYPELSVYNDYIDLNRIYIVNNPYRRGIDPRNWLLQLKVLLHMRRQKPDIVHYEQAFPISSILLYGVRAKYIMTVHDPITHSGQEKFELARRIAFKKATHYVLLSIALKEEFKAKYSIPEERITLNHMGCFDFLKDIKPEKINIHKPYILFWGQIQQHKGLEYLCEAMLAVHKQHPEICLYIAGRGGLYFDYTPYADKEFILFDHEFVSVPKLAGLLQNCLFAVVPYKDATQSGVVQTAFSAGVPLVVTNVGDLPLSCKDGVMGKVVPPCDAKALAKAILEMLDHPEMIEVFRNNINQIWQPSMSWVPIANTYLTLYEKVLTE